MKLVIVESPAKAKTIGKYLGEDYKVDASGGHIRDLPTKKMGVDIKNNYRPEYEVSPTKKDTIARLKEEVKKADEVFLATDPDREGEAISWHLQTVLKLKANQKNRITFNEISKKAVQKAILNPGYIDMNLVNAQQARRVLDRLVGYTLSPVLCKKIQGKLSAGRVQSSALKIMVDREREIKAFVPKEFWNITALVEKPKFEPSFKILLTEKDGKKWVVGNKQQSEEALSAIEGKEYIVDNVKLSVTRSNPLPPFTTSTMQQDGVNKLRMTSAVVMSTAQQLYEGVEIKGMGHVALVTYIRTDSVRISDDASREARELITNRYGAKYVPATPNKYFSKKGAQDAHEAIRPINLSLSPDSIKGLVDTKQYNLYKLIYERFLASQCVSAEYNSVAIKVKCGQYGFKANGRTVLFDGYTAIYGEGKSDEDDNEKLPKLIEGDKLNLLKLDSEQKFTKPVSRYTESSLIKAMEDNGIGRPSTFATILSTLYKREYVTKDGKNLIPSELGITVTEYLEKYFSDFVDVEFTADMENKLDAVEEGGEWEATVDKYYKPLEEKINIALAGERVQVADEASDIICEKCGAPMVYKTGRFGKYLACSNYPICTNHRSLKVVTPPKETDEICEKCGGKMVERESRYGKYLSCENFPKCKNTRAINEIVGKCPKCGKDVAKRVSKKGKVFYGCTGYPDCDFLSWDIPSDKKCPKCGAYLLIKEGKDSKTIHCSNSACDFSEKTQ